MLLLLFECAAERYALGTDSVVEVTPLVDFTPVPQAPAALAGLFNYRGIIVPTLDLSTLIAGLPARRLMSTRVLIVRYPLAAGHALLGLVVEHVMETIRAEDSAIRTANIEGARSRFFRGVFLHDKTPVLLVDTAHLLTPELRDALALAAGWAL